MRIRIPVLALLTLVGATTVLSGQTEWVSDTIDSEMGDGQFVRTQIGSDELRLTITCHPTGNILLFVEDRDGEPFSPSSYAAGRGIANVRIRFDSLPSISGKAFVLPDEENTLSFRDIQGFGLLFPRTIARGLIRAHVVRFELPYAGAGLRNSTLYLPEDTRVRIQTVFRACHKRLP